MISKYEQWAIGVVVLILLFWWVGCAPAKEHCKAATKIDTLRSQQQQKEIRLELQDATDVRKR